MSPESRLEEVISLINFRLYHLADQKIDSIYEDFTQGQIEFTEVQENLMFELIDRISTYLYG